MTREILFRGKRVDNGEWVEGYYSPVNIPITGNMGHFINVGGYRAVEIDPETVSQFTGLCDKNGRKIFEGDIVCYEDEIGVIKYDMGDARFIAKFNGWVGNFADMAGDWFEIIGSIYDNPELFDGRET
jgi:uncharacterized phage protein (TIGR01671 family)|nr:MAG TPA: YopX protein [Caudoviricetes sp.]